MAILVVALIPLPHWLLTGWLLDQCQAMNLRSLAKDLAGHCIGTSGDHMSGGISGLVGNYCISLVVDVSLCIHGDLNYPVG